MYDKRKRRTARSRSNRRYSVKKNKRKTILLTAGAIFLAAVLGVGIWAFFHFRTFDSYSVTSTIELSNTDERTSFHKCDKYYARVACDGITFFDRKEILWAETFEMVQPLVAVCAPYMAVADLKGSDIYIFDELGLVNRFSLSHPITTLEISKQGVVAASTVDDQSNFIEVLDKEGNELFTAKSVFSSSGYLMDIALAEDGTKLAGSFLRVSEGTLESSVVFYDFNKTAEENSLAAGFNQYKDTVVTDVKFLDKNKVCAVGDNAITIYDVSGTPEIVYEDLELTFEIQSLFFDRDRIGMVVEEETSQTNYTIKVFNSSGKLICNQGTDFTYNRVLFAGDHVVLHSVNDCVIYSFAGVKKFSYTFDEPIEYFLSCSNNGLEYLYATAADTEFIRLK